VEFNAGGRWVLFPTARVNTKWSTFPLLITFSLCLLLVYVAQYGAAVVATAKTKFVLAECTLEDAYYSALACEVRDGAEQNELLLLQSPATLRVLCLVCFQRCQSGQI